MTYKDRPLLRWLIPGTLVVGTSWFAGCSSKESASSSGTGGGEAVMCVAPEVECAGRCVNTASNSLNCGACNAACGSGQICENSACVMGSCPTGTTSCNGACVNLQTDARNCGACDAQCPSGGSCVNGGCVGGGSGGASGTGGTGAGGASGSATGGATTGGTDATGGTAGDVSGGTGGGGPTGGAAGSGMAGGSGGSTATGGSAGKGGSGGGSTDACHVWVATTGKDTNPGTEASPVATLPHAYDVLCPKPPDGTPNGTECAGTVPHTICVKSGTYNMTERFEFKKTRTGTAQNRVTLQGDPAGTLAQRPVISFANQPRLTSCNANVDNMTGFTINADYVTLKNVIVERANDTCVLIQGTQGLVENVLVRNCDDTGMQISSGAGEESPLSGTNNTVRNCDSTGNYDVLCQGENADGFAIKEGSGEGNVFTGCRSWDNVDDGFDFFAWTDPVRLENSWAFDMSHTHNVSGKSDGNGFKLGGMSVSATHILSGLYATGNTRGSNGSGFTHNSNPATLSCTGGCATWGNTDNSADMISGLPGTAPTNATVAKMSADSARNADGSLKPINSL